MTLFLQTLSNQCIEQYVLLFSTVECLLVRLYWTANNIWLHSDVADLVDRMMGKYHQRPPCPVRQAAVC